MVIKLPRVYSLGSSPIASVLSYEISQLPLQPKVPQVILLLNDQKKLDRFLLNESRLTVRGKGQIGEHCTQFMASCSPPVYSTGEAAMIENLVISEPNNKSLSVSLNKYSKSIGSTSNILLLNPFFGSIDSLYNYIWNGKLKGKGKGKGKEKEKHDPSVNLHLQRPNLLMGLVDNIPPVISNTNNEFTFQVNNSRLAMDICSVPREFESYSYEKDLDSLHSMETNNVLFKLLHETSVNSKLSSTPLKLDIQPYAYGDLLLKRLENVMVTGNINVLTSLYDCKFNGELLQIKDSTNILQRLIREQIDIILNSMTFINKIPNYQIALDQERLLNIIIDDLKKNCNKTSKMKKDLDSLNLTNINQEIGYFVKLAKYHRINCKWNSIITQLVKGKAALIKYRALNYSYL
ncbi:hypothetical protein Kpol_340p4 [Vanderwaltozyma polyspora DSM 70294]|uniref:Ketopantoate reductase C-terminal domain-containing protein n=1 Tax=Vanderwaltozyma polyspora (strain ATCC 22028 / DSM 70294 / BCRC 21397 / CBS 2163 / NBRC 10782 / NRRL Y-8283 / UCD 57-17) TaxID=436907 RepID=A7TSU9_VANPO|nr:uncharacterized protein Kpol_340p4 [Vanderwaltozyma polyspora DSM 70294]EDO14657.1 hypothetical protein Kpol_340p4 [Vanderwaltozyma polyspora DSM 70294]